MGHSEAMSKDNYQCPASVKELLLNIMGKMLGHMDTCNYHYLFVKKYIYVYVRASRPFTFTWSLPLFGDVILLSLIHAMSGF